MRSRRFIIFLITALVTVITAASMYAQMPTSMTTLLSCEDQLKKICKVEQQFTSSGPKTADTLIYTGASLVHSLVCIGTDGTAAAGTIILYDNIAESGTKIFEWDVQAVAYTTPVVIPLNAIVANGLYLGYTTTNDVKCHVIYRS